VVLSNQATQRVVELYGSLGFHLVFLKAPRRISCDGDRTPADEVLVVPPIAGVPASAPGGPVPGRKSLGVKEPIIFMWKIVGRSGHMNVTLFKSVEREEVETQIERLTRDGYYSHLQILEATAKVEQPPQPKEVKKAKVREAPAKAPERPVAAKSTPLRIPGKPAEPKKTKKTKPAEKSTAKPGKTAKAKPASKPKRTKKK
jgi:hypothetical protein